MNNDEELNNKKQEAGQKTAHVAGRAVSRYFGGELGGKVYDAASRTKLGQGLERAVGNKIARTPGVNELSKKANDAGVVDTANRAVDNLNGKSPNTTSNVPNTNINNVDNINNDKSINKNDSELEDIKQSVDKNKIQRDIKNDLSKTIDDSIPESLSNNLRNQLNRRLYLNGKNSMTKEEKKDLKDDIKENDEDSKDFFENEAGENKGTVKKILTVILIVILLPLIIGIILFATIGAIIELYSPAYSLKYHKTDLSDSYTVYTDKDSKEYKLEQDYNNAILGSKDGSVKGIIAEYQEKYGVKLDWYLLDATIRYRYVAVDNNLAYNDEGSNSIDETEVEDILNGLSNDNSEENSNNSSSSIDYSAAKKKIETVAALMITKNGSSYSTDIEIGGNYYNRLIDSNFLKTYYKDMLKDDTYESRKDLVDEIFEYANSLREILESEDSPNNGGVVGDTSVVYLQSCTKPKQYTYKDINGIKVFDMALVNEGTKYPLYLSLRDYVKGVIYRENFKTEDKYREATKVQAIMALSFLLKDSRSGFDLKSGEMYFPTETCRQAACDPNYGCTSVSGVASYSGTDRGGGTVHRPLNEKEQAYLDSILDEVFGLIIVKKGVTSSSFSGTKDMISFNYCNTLGGCSSCHAGSCVGQTESNHDSEAGMDYKAIFQKYFTSLDYDIINITEGLYYQSTGENINGISGSTTGSSNEDYHYHQSDSPWDSQNLCGSGAISANGCNITSAAIAISILKNQKITPETLNNRKNDIRTCSASSRPQMIMDFARLYGLSATAISKSDSSAVNDMLKKLATGNYVAVLRIAKNGGLYNTKNGHYVAAVGVKTEDGTNKLLIWDPGNKSSSRDNAWVDVNYIIKYLQPTYSFILIGK